LNIKNLGLHPNTIVLINYYLVLVSDRLVYILRFANLLDKRNFLAALIAFVAGVLLIISGEQGPHGTYSLIIQKLSILVEDQLILTIAKVIALILITISSLGGFAVLIGGYLIIKRNVFFGKILIGLGAGFGIISFLFLIATLIGTQELAAVIARHTLMEWTGITLSVIARALAK